MRGLDQVIADRKPPILRYEPGNPDADAKGYVAYRALLAIEQMLSCKTEACLTTSAALEVVLARLEQEAKRSDKVFDGPRFARGDDANHFELCLEARGSRGTHGRLRRIYLGENRKQERCSELAVFAKHNRDAGPPPRRAS